MDNLPNFPTMRYLTFQMFLFYPLLFVHVIMINSSFEGCRPKWFSYVHSFLIQGCWDTTPGNYRDKAIVDNNNLEPKQQNWGGYIYAVKVFCVLSDNEIFYMNEDLVTFKMKLNFYRLSIINISCSSLLQN